MQRLITSLVRMPARALELSSKHRTAAMTSTKLLRASQMKAQIETRKGKENLHVFSSMGEEGGRGGDQARGKQGLGK